MHRAIPLVMLVLLSNCTPTRPPAPSPEQVEPAEARGGPDEPSLPVRGEGPPAPAHEQELRRIGFGWGADQTRDLPVFAAVAAARPDLFLFLGDNVRPWAGQSDGKQDTELGRLRWAYGEMNLNAQFAAFNMSTPILATWSAGDAGGAEADDARRSSAEAAFESYWGAGAVGPDHPGVFGARIFGPPGRRVQILLLDLWSFRPIGTTPASPEATLLGEAQWRWLAEELRRPAELRLVVSPMPVQPETEGWAGFPRERRRLLRALRTGPARGVIALSGGTRPAILNGRTGLFERRPYEVTTAALSGSEPGFGLVEVDWTGRTVTLSERGLDGGARSSVKVPFADLGL